FWGLIAVALMAGHAAALGLALALVLVEARLNFARAAAAGAPFTFYRVFLATLRQNLSYLYQLCAFLSRYYLIPVSLAAPLLPVWAGLFWGLHLSVALVQYIVLRPKLGPPAFIFYFTLEQASYQAGVWWACFRSGFYTPVLPRLRVWTWPRGRDDDNMARWRSRPNWTRVSKHI
ncbi:MAG: hypothetical protein AB1896_21605, partial [Thermodesulfobacteriota bacterium]